MTSSSTKGDEVQGGGASGKPDRAVVNGAASVSALRASVPSADDHDPYWEYEDEDCWNCGGEGYVSGCSWDWQCDTWDGDSCLCTRPCHICHPPKLDPELRAVLAAALSDTDGSPKGPDRNGLDGEAATAGAAQAASPGGSHE